MTRARTRPAGRLLLYSVVGLCLAFLTTITIAVLTGDGGWVTITSLAKLQRQEVVYNDDLKVFVVFDDPGPVALSAVNPHFGGHLMYCPRSGQFQGRYAEKFDRFGIYYAGPAPRNMDRVEVRVADGFVQVNPDEVFRGRPRPEIGSEGSSALPPRGAFCPDPINGAGGIFGPMDT